MKIDKEKLTALTALPDNELWCEVRKIAKSYGFTLPESTPSECEMQKLRSAVSGELKLSMTDAVKMINDYKRRAGK